MKLYVQDAYPEFHCIASACRHTCCAGWEICVDEASAERYRSLPGKTGEKLRQSLIREGGTWQLRTGPDGRCPFLTAEGLCELILTLGEEALCAICREHPRWYNDLADRTEAGLGLCCEEAARILLSREEPMRLILWEDDGGPEEPEQEESELRSLRDGLIALAQDRTRPLAERMERILQVCGYGPLGEDPALWRDRFLALERLDEAWTEELRRLTERSRPAEDRDLPGEQLLCSLLYRHVMPGAAEGLVPERVACAVLGTRLVLTLYSEHGAGAAPEELTDLARMFSGEIEYSDENLDRILLYLSCDRRGKTEK